MGDVLLYIGAVVAIGWGIGHLAATRSAVVGFGDLSRDNRLTITMEWIAEGLTLCFVGVVAALATAKGGEAAETMVLACAGMLTVLAVLSFFTGARTSVTPMRLCPFVKLSVATLYTLGNVI